jgi:hypothetical protein
VCLPPAEREPCSCGSARAINRYRKRSAHAYGGRWNVLLGSDTHQAVHWMPRSAAARSLEQSEGGDTEMGEADLDTQSLLCTLALRCVAACPLFNRWPVRTLCPVGGPPLAGYTVGAMPLRLARWRCHGGQAEGAARDRGALGLGWLRIGRRAEQPRSAEGDRNGYGEQAESGVVVVSISVKCAEAEPSDEVTAGDPGSSEAAAVDG